MVFVILHLVEYVQGSEFAHAEESKVRDQEDEEEHDDWNEQLINNVEFVSRVEILVNRKNSHANRQAYHYFEEGALQEA